MPAPKVNYVLAATMLATGMSYQEIGDRLGGNPETIRKTLWRRGVSARRVQGMPVSDERVQTVAFRIASQASMRVRESLSDVLENHVTALKQVKAKPSLLRIQSVGAALEPLARTAKIVYGWGDEDKSGVVMVGRMTQAEESPAPVIDLPPASVEPGSNPS